MLRLRYTRIASIVITTFGVITNAAVTIQVLAVWRAFKWEPESEWETSGDKWKLDCFKVIWALLLVYFSSATSVCAVGLVGVLKVRLLSSVLLSFMFIRVFFNRINHPMFAFTATIQ